MAHPGTSADPVQIVDRVGAEIAALAETVRIAVIAVIAVIDPRVVAALTKTVVDSAVTDVVVATGSAVAEAVAEEEVVVVAAVEAEAVVALRSRSIARPPT